jgi:hypothetical protein
MTPQSELLMDNDTIDGGGRADPIDYGGTLLIADMVRVLKTSDNTIRRRLKAGTFPIPPLDGIDNRLRWSGPVVKRWLDRNGPMGGR